MVLRFFLLGAFLFMSCAEGERNNPDDEGSRYYIGVSSNSRPGSSSASVKNYCVYAEIGQCYFGLYSACPGVGGKLDDSCPYNSSSSAETSSSSHLAGGSSSSQSGQSSSSEALPEYGYCVFISDRMCLTGPLRTCPPGGALSNSCPYGSSSSAAVSSSSALPSSSSISSSSSSALPSSSSMLPSSSSAPPSSSSALQSSSSILPSSSSALPSSSSALPSSSSVATYTVTYNAGTGVTGVTVPANQTKTQNVALTLSSAVPTRTGYAFAGWNTSSNGSGMSYASGASYVDNAGVTLYAQWTANTYTITYNANNGTGAPGNQTKTHDITLTLSSTVPTRTGYVFAGWNTSSNGSGTSYASGASYTANAGVTLYAQWTANTYTVTYNANNGTGAPANQTKTHDVALTLSAAVPARTGYAFAGWNTSSNGSGTSYVSGASYTANAGVTLYAQWTANTYTVTYNANNGTGAPSNQTKTHDVALTLSAAVPTRTSYAFAGWNTSANGSGTSYSSGASYTANAVVTLYAQWSSTVVSNCDGQTFRTVAIGTQTWMAENLNCNVEGSKCYSNNESNCATYGRLYNWATAMALPSSCTSSSCASQIGAKHRGICPTGWHIPSNADWDKLVRYVDGTNGTSSPYDSPTAGRYLKATSGWNSCGPPGSGSSYLCEDSHGFAALPGSYGYSDGSFSNVGIDGVWWSSSENGAYYAYGLGMSYNYEYVSWYSSNKSNLFSVRCLQD